MAQKFVYLTEFPRIPVQCIVAEIPQRLTQLPHRVKRHFETRFGPVVYVEMIEHVVPPMKFTGNEPLSKCFVMFASPEIAAVAMNVRRWRVNKRKLKISAAELPKQLERHPQFTRPPPYRPRLATNETSPFDSLNVDCLMHIFDYLDLTTLCALSAADTRIHTLADEYRFRKINTIEFYDRYRYAFETLLHLQRELYFIGQYLEHVTICCKSFRDTSIFHVTSVLESCANLRTLRIDHCDWNMHELAVLSEFESKATTLQLYHCRLRFKQASTILRSFPNLERLIVNNTLCDEDGGLRHLLDSCRRLHTIHVFNVSRVPPKTVAAMVERNRPTLRSLKLVEMPRLLPDAFGLLLGMPDLEFVSVDVQRLSQPADILKLCDALPNLKGVHIRCLRTMPRRNAESLLEYVGQLRLERLELDFFPMSARLKEALRQCGTVRELQLSILGRVHATDVSDIINSMGALRDMVLATYSFCESELREELVHCEELKRINFQHSKSSYLGVIE